MYDKSHIQDLWSVGLVNKLAQFQKLGGNDTAIKAVPASLSNPLPRPYLPSVHIPSSRIIQLLLFDFQAAMATTSFTLLTQMYILWILALVN